jgi:formylglycine-generating enzyme required for sulfatase activity
MTGASGKKNRMFVTKNTFKFSRWLMFCIIISAFALHAPGSWADDSNAFAKTKEAYKLPDADQQKELQQLLSNLAAKPDDQEIIVELDELLGDVLRQAESLIDAGAINQAGQMLSLIESINPELDGLAAAEKRLRSFTQTKELLIAGNAALAAQRMLEPENSSALHYFSQALANDPGNRLAQQGLSRVQGILVEQALESARDFDFETAENLLFDASTVQTDQKQVEDGRVEVSAFKLAHANELEQRALAAIESGNFNVADISIIDLIALGDNEDRVRSLRERLSDTRFYGGFEPGQIITDELLKSGGKAPHIVVIPSGSFLMGTQESSDEKRDNERPQHRVIIRRGFGLGVREVTVGQFRKFVEHTDYRTLAERRGSSSIYDEATGRLSPRARINWQFDYKGHKASPDMPVLHVSLYDAHAYVKWLATETGKAYRLPSETEYEYVARAGGSGTYWWGEGSPAEAVENLTGERDLSPVKRQWTTYFRRYGDGYWGPGPAGAIGDGNLVHPMGVYDIAGNASEWTEDCWHQNYIKAPVDGSAWVNPGCKRRVVRGGYWASAPEQSRAAYRLPVKAESYGPVIGFRIARDL